MSFNNNHINDDFSPSSGGDGSELITRQNYEEYFLLYVDHELNAAERKAVEVFVEQNPDLAEELVMLQQSVLRPDKQITFNMKAALLQPVSESGAINETNYEEYFVLYGDNELTNAEKDLVEQFVYKHPQYQAEFELIQQVKLIPDQAIAYPDKNELYRTEEDHRVVPFAWRKLAVAAVLLLFMGGFVYYAITRNGGETTGTPMAGNEPTQQPNTNTTDPSKSSNAVTTAPRAAGKTNTPQTRVDDAVHALDKQMASAETKNKIQPTRNIQITPDVPHKEDDLVAPQERDLAAKAVKVNTVEPEKRIIVNTTVDERSLAVNTPKSATPIDDKSMAYGEEPTDESIYIANTSINKAPLRGLFRKVTRVLDKATNAEPEDSKGGIRIASFSIGRNK